MLTRRNEGSKNQVYILIFHKQECVLIIDYPDPVGPTLNFHLGPCLPHSPIDIKNGVDLIDLLFLEEPRGKTEIISTLFFALETQFSSFALFIENPILIVCSRRRKSQR